MRPRTGREGTLKANVNMGIKGEIAFGTIQERTYSAVRADSELGQSVCGLSFTDVTDSECEILPVVIRFCFFYKYEFFTIRICNKRTARYSVIALYFGRLDGCGLNNRTSILGVDKTYSALTPRTAICSVSNADCVWGM